MKIDKSSFDKIFETRFWQKLKESLVPFDSTPNKSDFLNELYTEITRFTYSPSNPRDYIVINKHNGISRYVPTFSRKDYCVYFLCIKLIEEEIAVNRVEGTFGGWTLGNQIRLKEEQEILELDYIPFNTINELSWVQEWQSFQNIAKKYRDLDAWGYYINLDIANFYDCINLSILERKIRHAVPKSKQEVVTLLFHFLRNWNKRIEGYNPKTVGIPQDEIGDCSRILANFYLQDYDQTMSDICFKSNSKYVRFADDQIIFAKDVLTARNILFKASKELLRINLNFNSSKVKEFDNKNTFNEYWAYDLFDFLSDKEDGVKINLSVEQYLLNVKNNVRFRGDSVLKKILSVNNTKIETKSKSQLISMFMDSNFLAQLTTWHFKRIREFVNDDTTFFKELDLMIEKVPFNSFHYNLLAYYRKERAGFDVTILEERINALKLQ